jgi:hypothetical protein
MNPCRWRGRQLCTYFVQGDHQTVVLQMIIKVVINLFYQSLCVLKLGLPAGNNSDQNCVHCHQRRPVWCTPISASKSNADNLILRLFLCHFLHMMSSWRHDSIHNNTSNKQTPPPWWWSRPPLQRHGFDDTTPPEGRAALRMFLPWLVSKDFVWFVKLM